jgi:hypothetical protein
MENKMKKRLLVVLALVGLMSILVVSTALALTCSTATWCSSDQWGQTTMGAFIMYNDVWGATSGQTIYANSASNWGVTANFPETSGVKSYPNASLDMSGKTIDTLGSCTSSFNVSTPSSGSWETAYDIWVPSEVMLWMNKNGAVGPIAASWNSDGTPVAEATNVSVGGHTWNVYHGGSNVVSFVRTSNTSSGTVDILAVLNWIKAKGWITGNSNLASFQFGFEITSAPGGLTFSTNSYSMNCGGRGGGTAAPTATRTSTPIAGATATRTRTPVAGATVTRTPTVGPTATSGSGTTCSPVTATITAPFTKDGAGTFCWQSSNLGSYINSWNTNSLIVNGVNLTNVWVSAGSLPAKVNGYWYVSYNSSVAWGHFEAK